MQKCGALRPASIEASGNNADLERIMIAKFVQITSKNIIIWVYDSKNYDLMGLRANLQPGGANITNLQEDLER